jgi:putative phage-type endonuclease
MSGTIHYMEQRSDEWMAHRVGRVTASKIVDIMATTRSGPSASRGNYAAEIIAERLTGESAESGFTNAAMQWGTDQEPHAIAAYSFMHDTDVEAVGFIDHPTIDLSGCSPDGLIGTQGMCEIKCPNTKTHLDTLMGASIPKKYMLQMQWQMACSGRAWCDFVSYDPRLHGAMQLHVERVQRDPALIAEIETEVRSFQREVDLAVEKLRAKFGTEAA